MIQTTHCRGRLWKMTCLRKTLRVSSRHLENPPGFPQLPQPRRRLPLSTMSWHLIGQRCRGTCELDPRCWIRPPTQFCPQMTQIYADTHKRTICVCLQEKFSSPSVKRGFHGRNDLPSGGIQHPASSIEDLVDLVILRESFELMLPRVHLLVREPEMVADFVQ